MTQQQDRQHSDQSDENNALMREALKEAVAATRKMERSTDDLGLALKELKQSFDVPWEKLGERDDMS